MYRDTYQENENHPYGQVPYGQPAYPGGDYPPPPVRYATGPYPTNHNREPQRGRRPRYRLRLFLLLLLLVLGGTLLYLLLSGLGGTERGTAIVQSQSLGSQFSGEGIIVRNEELTGAESITSIDYVAEEGSLVYKNSVLCYVYSAGYNQQEITRLQNYRERIQQYYQTLDDVHTDPNLQALNTTISSLALGVRTLVQGKGSGSLANLEKQLKEALTARKDYLRQKYPDDQELTTLYKDEAQQIKRIESWTTSYPAQEESLVSFYTDGYESTVNGDTFESITPQQARSVLSGQKLEVDIATRGRQAIYRTVLPNSWYILLLSNSKDWNPIEGQAYKVQLEGFANFLVDATVVSFTRLGGEILVRMAVNGDVKPVLNLRTCRMLVGEFVDGLSVPWSAVVPEGDGWNVAVSDGKGGGQYVPVTVISTDGVTSFIQPIYAGSLMAGQEVFTF